MSEKYTLQQAKTAKRLIKYFAKFQASIFLISKGKLWNKWPGGFPIMVVETKGAKSNKIRNIDTIKIDTFDKKNNFFSARRSLQLKHDDYGRNISIIMIN